MKKDKNAISTIKVWLQGYFSSATIGDSRRRHALFGNAQPDNNLLRQE